MVAVGWETGAAFPWLESCAAQILHHVHSAAVLCDIHVLVHTCHAYDRVALLGQRCMRTTVYADEQDIPP